jgi:hypothetical protein
MTMNTISEAKSVAKDQMNKELRPQAVKKRV